VARSRLLSAALLAVLALGLDASRGVPARSTSVTRALWCCSTVCHHAHGAMAATRCCGAEHDASELTATPPRRPAEVGPPVVALAPLPVAPADGVVGAPDLHRVSTPRARGTPVFLSNRTLRL
jgi:hypothetical protein